MSESVPPRVAGRSRQTNVPGGRQKTYKVKVTSEQSAALELQAMQHRVTVQRLLVESALSQSGETPSERREQLAALFQLTRLLASVANNVNQIARKANIEDEFPEEARAALVSIRRLIERLNDVIDGVADPR